jgi:ER-derived vesicles protein
MAQIRGTAGYNLGSQNTFGGPSRGDAGNDPSPLDQIREQTSKIEDFLDTLSEPIKPYVSQSYPASKAQQRLNL